MALPHRAPDAPPPRRRPPHSLAVVRELDYPELVDWSSWYLTDEEDMGQTPRQSAIITVAQDVTRVRVAELGWVDAFVGSDAFVAWVEAEPLVRVSPDLYVLARCPTPLPPSFQLWRPGHTPPLLAAEIVSEDWRKDYEQAPPKYAQLGVEELVVFDPDAAAGDARQSERVALQVFRRSTDGLFQRVYSGPGAAWLQTLEVFAVVVPTAATPLLRLAYDRDAKLLVPTAAEKAERERDAAERERDAAERERDAAERERETAERERDTAERQRDDERSARVALEARLTALEAELRAKG